MFRLTLATRLALSMFLLAGWTATTGAADNAQLTQREDPYFLQAQAQLQQRLKQTPNTNRAKNVILVVGDGMGFSTVTAARIFEGQQRGVDGESNVLAWEAFPYLAAAKTYSADAQITDSAPSAVAMTTGVKTINDLMGLDHTATLNNCEDQQTKAVTTLWEMAATLGMSTGAVTTATITHATPGATYAHIANRDWESDAKMPANALAAGCRDIARQLVEMKYGNGLNVAMGGGRANFLPDSVSDPEYPGKQGARKDGRDLTQAWLQRYGERGQYVWNQAQFNKIEPGNVDHLLALFEPSHMNFEHDRRQDAAGEPSLAEMAGKAIDILSRNPEGYLLLVEGGRVDHGSHNGNAYRTLSDAVALNEAVKTIVDKVDLDDTLVIVTGDHSHTLTIAGYAKRGNPILGISVGVDGKPRLGSDGKPYTTLGFANGPGGAIPLIERPALTMEQTTAPDFIQPALVPLNSETHGGEDLGIYAIGPWAHLFQGTVEENYTFHVMNYASRIGERLSKR
ncbi:TPA: alkaline phosphatase [Serratia marcescens]|uniref:alkaline phosphatase n=1 Tax=Serratia marcescens TaxID=615 RepID=UPI000B5E5D24|nr:alkaline phosphatase [Serratia marcescens]ASM18480.1 alkaline phosphatase [Serratia marcescens]MBY4849252.1 alkaline phosphatase [Serratia marcescens]MCH9867364.1 alkaline phosphatase [Serratia marcescens]